MKTIPIIIATNYYYKLIISFLILLLIIEVVYGAPTTTLKVSVIDDNKTVFEKVVDYQYCESNLPVFGDGVTHYYHQGPVFQGDRWDPNETINLRDMGAVKGTSIKDLCDLAGSLSPSDDVMVKAVDGYHLQITYDTISSTDPGTLVPVLCWYNEGESSAGERQGLGYVPDYYNGIRLVYFAPENPKTGKHVFGNSDMKTYLPENAQYFYSGMYPSTGGLSAKWVDEVRIYKGGYHGNLTAPLKDSVTPTPTKAASSSPLSIIAGFCLLLLYRRG